jgi:hypothetical protein
MFAIRTIVRVFVFVYGAVGMPVRVRMFVRVARRGILVRMLGPVVVPVG